MMTNEMAITTLEAMGAIADKNSLGREACSMAIEALEKQIPKKPIEVISSNNEFIRDVCGNCEHIFGIYQYYDFCPYCGNKIDWMRDE